ncbi:hypothetical protein PINS_up014128 [Pythium insidiosum]|nr:hypothetical protein PINS_up014128 [Pythium insidiosum]
MITPDAFARTHKRYATDVVRVALERKGVIGFIEIHESMTLLEARTVIWENVDNAPPEFQFLLDDGAPVSARQEHTQRVAAFYPCVKIRECRRVASPRSQSVSPWRQSIALRAAACSESSAVDLAANSSEKISVWTPSGDEFTVWVSEQYTFQQLRVDAARYWNVSAANVALVDAEGCLWPEQARILSVMSLDELLRRKIILDQKGGTARARSTRGDTSFVITSRSPSQAPTWRSIRASSVAVRKSPPMSAAALAAVTEDTSKRPAETLWLIFTFYCVNGDCLELEYIRAHQFNKLLRDAQVLGSSGGLTAAMADIIYTSETKGKPHSIGKMNYDEFLNALVKVAVARQCKHPRQLLGTADEEALFQRLVVDHILPLASRWPSHLWADHTAQLRSTELVSFISKFMDSLLDIFMFYAKSHVLHAVSGIKEFHMSYADYLRFFSDFAIANLQVSSVDAAQVFVAACLSPPMHDAIVAPSAAANEDDNDDERVGETPGSSFVRVESEDGSANALAAASTTTAATIRRLIKAAEGLVIFVPADAQIGRICMSFSAFLDALGRLGLTSFSKTKTVRPLQAVKAVFHHLSRGLTRSRVLEILHNHGSTSIHSAKLYSGSVSFNNKFLDMWRYEGSPDYLTGRDDAIGLGAERAVGLAATTAETAALAVAGRTSVISPTSSASNAPVSPSRRLTSSPALFHDRVVPNGAGRGREALDRLVHNAFIRNAITQTSKVDQLQGSSLVGGEGLGTAATVAGAPGSNGANTASGSIVNRSDTQQTAPCHASASSGGVPASTFSLVLAHGESHDHVAGKEKKITDPRRECSTGSLAVQSLPLEDEKAVFESILLKGGVFKKYGQWGNPHRRFVWCPKEFDAIYWRAINKKSSLSKDGIAVSSLIAVLPGNSPRTRYAFMKHLSDGTYSLHGAPLKQQLMTRRTFCLEQSARSVAACRWWRKTDVLTSKPTRRRRAICGCGRSCTS